MMEFTSYKQIQGNLNHGFTKSWMFGNPLISFIVLTTTFCALTVVAAQLRDDLSRFTKYRLTSVQNNKKLVPGWFPVFQSPDHVLNAWKGL